MKQPRNAASSEIATHYRPFTDQAIALRTPDIDVSGNDHSQE